MAANTADLLDAKHSPSMLSAKTGVRRVNNGPLYVVGAGVLLFMIAFAVVLKDRADQQEAPVAAETEKVSSTRAAAMELVGKIGPIVMPEAPVAAPAPVAPDPAPAPVLSAVPPAPAPKVEAPAVPVVRLDEPPPPPRGASSTVAPRVDEGARRRSQQREQTLEAALKAGTDIPLVDNRQRIGNAAAGVGGMPGGMAGTGGAPDPVAVYKARLAQIRASGLVPGGMGSGTGVAVPSMGAGQ